MISLMKKTSDQVALFKVEISVNIFGRRNFFSACSPDMTAFDKRMDTPGSKLMHDSEK